MGQLMHISKFSILGQIDWQDKFGLPNLREKVHYSASFR